MTDEPAPPSPDDPFGGLPPELRQMLEALGGSQMFQQLGAMVRGSAGTGPVNWDLAGQVARQLAAPGDRAPTEDERDRAEEAHRLAEHWLDEGSLPAPPDAGLLIVASRQDWVAAALDGLAPMVEPVAEASTNAMAELAASQMDELGLGDVLGQLGGGADIRAMMTPMGAMLTGTHAGQVIGQLARQLVGQYELGVPTAPRSQAFHIAVNVTDAFEGYDLDLREVAIVLALHEGAHRRLYHAVPWLTGHVHGLVWQFAEATEVDPDELMRMSQDLMIGVDPEDPESLEQAISKAGEFRLEPTQVQQRILQRVQGVVTLVQAWARSEVQRAAEPRLGASLGRIEEVLRRRRASHGDGEQLLAQLLGLDLKPDDETVGDRFVEVVEAAAGPDALREALAHPENLPDATELADPQRWLSRIRGEGDEADGAVPADLSSLLDAGDAPTELSAEERRRDREGD
ncbi:MAG TPA: zinc-dependent metalloprotease [Nitriliruptorales bacterium]